MSLTGFLLLEQLLITDATLAPLNRLRIIYAFGAAVALLVFGISAAIVASRWYPTYPQYTYHHSKIFLNKPKKEDHFFFIGAIIAAVIAFIGTAIYIGEAVARNRKSRII